MHEWFDLGVVAVGAGSDLTGAAAAGDFDSVTKRAKDYHQEYLRIKNKNTNLSIKIKLLISHDN